MVSTGPELSFSLTATTAGVYTCQASAQGFPPKISVARVQMRGPPVITEQSHTIFASVGEDFRIFCQATAVPHTERMFWTLDGNLVHDSQKILESGDGSEVRTSLLVQRATREQFGLYVCHVENQFERISSTVMVREIGSDGIIIIFVKFYPLIFRVPALVGDNNCNHHRLPLHCGGNGGGDHLQKVQICALSAVASSSSILQ